MLRNRRSTNLLRILTIIAAIASVDALSVDVEAVSRAKSDTAAYTVDFSSYRGGSADKWLQAHKYQFERDARNRSVLGLSIADNILTLDAKGRMSGFILNDSVNLKRVQTIRINWGINKYPEEVSYHKKVNNEALMLYIFFGKAKISSSNRVQKPRTGA